MVPLFPNLRVQEPDPRLLPARLVQAHDVAAQPQDVRLEEAHDEAGDVQAQDEDVGGPERGGGVRGANGRLEVVAPRPLHLLNAVQNGPVEN